MISFQKLNPHHHHLLSPLWLSWERIQLQCGRPGFDPWVGKIPWTSKRLPTPVFWPGESHGLYSPWVAKSWTRQNDFHFHFSLGDFQREKRLHDSSHPATATGRGHSYCLHFTSKNLKLWGEELPQITDPIRDQTSQPDYPETADITT